MQYLYFAHLEPRGDGGFLVTFPDVPEAITEGDSREEALANAAEALALALRGVIGQGRELPVAAYRDGAAAPVAVPADAALKLAVVVAFRESGMTKTELAARLHKRETEARRILDPDHNTRLPLLSEALAILGREIVVEVRKVA